MKSPMSLWEAVAKDLGDKCRACTARDVETVARRVEGEGISFLTITLPAFAKDFDEALDQGKVDHTQFAGFRFLRGTPRFLGGFLDLIFDRGDGVLLDDPSIDAIFAVRQLTRLFSKIELPCSYERERAAFDAYIKTEEDVRQAELEWSPDCIQDFSRVSRLLFGRVFSIVDFRHGTNSLVPKHGPGATADRLLGNEKFDLSEWHWRLEHGGFHSVDYLLPSPRFWKNLDRVTFSEPGAERPARVISVPKTLSTPRIIAIEPACMQYTQQAVAEALCDELESDSIGGLFVSFSDQEPNRELARKGSVDGSLATLDLSEASDRVSNLLVEYLLHGYTHLRDAVQACRSLKADVPHHGEKTLVKFASMGSALTFPMEAIVFTTVAFMAIEKELGHRLTVNDVKSFDGQVRVFGDDIIVPQAYAHSVMSHLELFGFKVNQHKSFWTGNFRESCGKEYFRGHDVSIVKLRRVAPSSLKDAQEVISWVSFRNQLSDAGFSSALIPIDSFLDRILKGFYPRVGRDSPLLGRVNPDGIYDVDGYDPFLHAPVSKGWMERAVLPVNGLDEEGALLKFFLKRGVLPFADRNHLKRSGRPLVVGIKLGRARPY